MENYLIEMENHEQYGIVTNSRNIAENLGKSHKHVLEGIDKIFHGQTFGHENLHSMIIEDVYTTSRNRIYRQYLLTKDGFTLYMFNIQGYNDFKIRYINEFNRMAKYIKEQNKTNNTYSSKDIIELNNKVDNLIQQNKTILSTMKKQPDKECIATSGQWCYEQYKKIDRYLLETKVLPLYQNYVILKHIYDSMWLKDKIVIEDYDIRAYGIDSVSKIKVISQHKELRESFEKHLTEIFQVVENFSTYDDIFFDNDFDIEFDITQEHKHLENLVVENFEDEFWDF